MRYIIYSVGVTKHSAWSELEAEYQQRLHRHVPTELRYVKNNTRLAKAIADSPGPVIALDEAGAQYSTIEFKTTLEQIADDTITFVIGDTDGLEQSVKQAAAKIISLSAMTFTHEMARVLLLEQLYRVTSIQIGHPYHRS